jgi:predicted nucleic acid-binding protein
VVGRIFGRGEIAIDVIAQKVAPVLRISAVKADESDNRILECAKMVGSEYIVNGDKHLLRLARFESISIITVATFLERERGSSSHP